MNRNEKLICAAATVGAAISWPVVGASRRALSRLSKPASLPGPGSGMAVAVCRSPVPGGQPLLRVTLRRDGELVPGLVDEVVHAEDTVSVTFRSDYQDDYTTMSKTCNVQLVVHDLVDSWSSKPYVVVSLYKDGRLVDDYSKEKVRLDVQMYLHYDLSIGFNYGMEKRYSLFVFSFAEV